MTTFKRSQRLLPGVPPYDLDRYEIDWSNPIAQRGLKFFAIADGSDNLFRELVSGVTPTVTGSSWATGTTTKGRYVQQSGSDKIEFGDVTHGIGDGGFTILLDAAWFDIADTWQTAMSLPTNSGYGIYLPRAENTKYIASWGSGTAVTEWSGATVVVGEWGDFGLTKGGGSSTPIGYKNGKAQTITSGNESSNLDNGTTGVDLFTNTSDEYGHCRIRSALLFSETLTEAEIWSLRHDRFQLLKPRIAKTYFIPSASAASYTLTANSGTYTYTGAAVGLSSCSGYARTTISNLTLGAGFGSELTALGLANGVSWDNAPAGSQSVHHARLTGAKITALIDAIDDHIP